MGARIGGGQVGLTGGANERAGGALPPPTLYVKKRPASTGRCLKRHSIVFKGVTIRRTGKPFHQGCLCHCRPTNINKHVFLTIVDNIIYLST